MSQTITDEVRSKYGAVAASALTDAHEGVRAVAEAFGYSAGELSSIPAEANMGLSCGNPTAFASLRPGETVLDLGCGGGLDVFLAGHRVGPTGKAIGIDMTSEMLNCLDVMRRVERTSSSTKPQSTSFHYPMRRLIVSSVIALSIWRQTNQPSFERLLAF